MTGNDKKPLLFWGLVLGIFFIVFFLWLPGFIQSVRTVVGMIDTNKESVTVIKDSVTPQLEELKKTFESFVKKIPLEEQQAQGTSKAPSVPSAEIAQNPRQYCERAGGIHQSRPGCTAFCSGKTPAQPYDVCIFLDGSECEQKMFHRGTCKKGQTQAAEDLMEGWSEVY